MKSKRKETENEMKTTIKKTRLRGTRILFKFEMGMQVNLTFLLGSILIEN